MKNFVKDIIIRYAIAVILALFVSVFYIIITPLTVYPVFYVMNLLYRAVLIPPSTIIFNGLTAQIIPACVAGAAYLLLIALNLTTPMPFRLRIKSLLSLILSFLVLNILRIIIFASIILLGFQYFDLAHKLSWYFGSTILVVLIWFANVKIFKIPGIPVYSDMRNIIKNVS